MSPSALTLALLVHAVAALALWWMSTHRPRLPLPEKAIDVTFEQPKEQPKPPPPAPQKRSAAPPVRLGLPPPAAITADKPSQAPSIAKQAQPATAPEPPSLEQAVPPPQTPAPSPPSTAFETSKPVPKPAPKPAPAAPSREAHALPPPAEQPPFRPSPLKTAPHHQPPAVARLEQPSPSPFVNPADVYNRARVADNYLWQVVRKLSGYHYQAHVNVSEGTTVVQVVIARDGRLLDIAVVRSSGFPALDQGVVAGVRAGSPYAPLPPEIHGDRATFTLPLVSSNRR
jgi:protein TonB